MDVAGKRAGLLPFGGVGGLPVDGATGSIEDTEVALGFRNITRC